MDMNQINSRQPLSVDLTQVRAHKNKYAQFSKAGQPQETSLPQDSVNIKRDSSDFKAERRHDNKHGRHDHNNSHDAQSSTSASSEPVQSFEEQTAKSRPPAEGQKEITIISTNDLHGYLKNMPEVAGIIHKLKAENPNAVVVDCGDVAYNPSFSDKHHYEPMTEIMNEIGYNVVTLGNHEFQWGQPTLEKEYLQKMDADVVCANVKDKKTHDSIPGTQPYVIKDVDGVKVGFVGVVTPKMATSAHPSVGGDVEKLNVESTLQKVVPEMKQKGAEVVVVLSHYGYVRDDDVARQIDGLDVIISGHDHQFTEHPLEVGSYPNKTYIFESASHAKYVAMTKITVDAKTHKVVSADMKQISTMSGNVPSDPEVEKIVAQYGK
jgi:2',3'-cyclic-nucleotide 2'-phosphodiesterase (5'-nucleotidase family)